MSGHENGQAVPINRGGRSKISSERWEQIKTARASGIGLREKRRFSDEGEIVTRVRFPSPARLTYERRLVAPKYLSTMLPRPFKDLEWHKGKKTRHRRHLSLLRQGPADH